MQRILSAITAVACVALGCASASSTEPVGSGHGQCAPRVGAYRASYTLRTGNCGPIPEEVVIYNQIDPDAGTQPSSTCSGPGSTMSVDNCEVTFDVTCPNNGYETGGSSRVVGNAKWSVSADHAASTVQFTLFGPAGQVRCTGTYDLAIVKQ